MRKQPDFGRVFRAHFGEIPRKVIYDVRTGPDRYHDIVFFNTLVHDARFCPKDLHLRGKRLRIPIKRDCWEIPSVSFSPTSGEMYFVHARITISPVEAITWEYDASQTFGENVEIELQNIWIDAQSLDGDTDRVPLILNGFHCKCILQTRYSDLRIRVSDTDVPYLRSGKKRPNHTSEGIVAKRAKPSK